MQSVSTCPNMALKGLEERSGGGGRCGLARYFHIAHKTTFYFLFKIFLMNVFRGLAKMEDLVKT